MRLPFAPLLLALPLLAGGKGSVHFRQTEFKAEVSITEAEQTQGLMWRRKIEPDQCMIFLYPEDRYHQIWMKNCFINLDVIFVDGQGKIVDIVENAPPCSEKDSKKDPSPCPTYGGKAISRHFIEFKAGTAKRLKMKLGDTLRWDLMLDNGQRVKGGAWGLMLTR